MKAGGAGSSPAPVASLAKLRRRLLSTAALTPAVTPEWYGYGAPGRYEMVMGAKTEHCLPFADDVEAAA